MTNLALKKEENNVEHLVEDHTLGEGFDLDHAVEISGLLAAEKMRSVSIYSYYTSPDRTPEEMRLGRFLKENGFKRKTLLVAILLKQAVGLRTCSKWEIYDQFSKASGASFSRFSQLLDACVKEGMVQRQRCRESCPKRCALCRVDRRRFCFFINPDYVQPFKDFLAVSLGVKHTQYQEVTVVQHGITLDNMGQFFVRCGWWESPDREINKEHKR